MILADNLNRKFDVVIIGGGQSFSLQTSDGDYSAKAILSATGSFQNPFIPEIQDRRLFQGIIMHSSQYQSPEKFRGKRIAVVGEGNSGAQILSEISLITETVWVTQNEPRFLPDVVDGRYLFDAASRMYEAKLQGEPFKPLALDDVVMAPSVKAARERGILQMSLRPFDRFSSDSLVWASGHTEKADVVIFCTGFKASLHHLASLHVVNTEGKVPTHESKATNMANLWLVGYWQLDRICFRNIDRGW